MKINRHNYEEYFILYADKELSSDERRMVEEFISLNPDLKDELDIYVNAVFLPDTSVGFDNKEELHHHDESLISYIDNELSYKEELELEKLINGSPKLQHELELYRKTKLQPATDIVFENKSVLYHSTERRRVVPMTIIRWSVAAAILLGISVTTITIFNNKPNGSTANVTPQKNTSAETLNNNVVENDAATKPITTIENNSIRESIKSSQSNKNNNIARSIANQKPIAKDKKVDIPLIVEKPKDNIASNEQRSNNLPTPQNNAYIDNNASQKPGEPITPVNGSQKGDEAVTSGNQPALNNGKQSSSESLTEPQFASLTTGEDGGQNKKSRGLFRKLTRVFEKNTGIKATDDDDKLHIAAFTVKLK